MSVSPRLALVLIIAALLLGALAAPAYALNPFKAVCGVAKVVSVGRVDPCGTAETVGRVLKAGGKLLSGHPGGAVSTLEGASSGGGAALALGALGVWVLTGAKSALNETAKVLSSTTSPQLRSTWFSGTYWRMAGIAAVLTLPFLFAAALQALLRGDLALLARAAFMHLPLAMLAVGIAAPLTMLVLAASDELSAIVSGAAGHQSTHFLTHAGLVIGTLTALSSPFLAFLIGVFTVTATLVLWLELLVRQTAVYVIVLMLPLMFAAFVWPARRVWAVRTIELLFALILSKFAIVAVLSLGAAALSNSLGSLSVARMLAGLVLVVMAAFMPWALLRLVPVTEVASSAAGALGHELRGLRHRSHVVDNMARAANNWVEDVSAHMRRQAQDVQSTGRSGRSTNDAEGRSASDAPPDAVDRQLASAAGRSSAATEGGAETLRAQENDAPAGGDVEASGAPASASAGAPATAGEASAGQASADESAPAPVGAPSAGPETAIASDGVTDDLADAPAAYVDHVTVPGAEDGWGTALLDAEAMTRPLSYGELDDDGRPRPPRVSGGPNAGHDPDPRPPVQDEPEGVL